MISLRRLQQGTLAALVVAIAACSSPSAIATPAPSAASTTARVERATVRQTIALTGSITPAAQYRLSFKAPGRLAERLVAVGDRVSAGQVLARLEVAELEASLVAARARYDQVAAGASAEDVASARLAVDTAQRTFDSVQRTNTGDLSAARDALARLVANYDAAKADLGLTTRGIAEDAATFRRQLATAKNQSVGAISHVQASVNQTADVVSARNAITVADSALALAQSLFVASDSAFTEYSARRDDLTLAIAAYDLRPDTGTVHDYQSSVTAFNAAATRFSASLDAVTAQLTVAGTNVTSAQTSLNGAAVRVYADLDNARVDLVNLQVTLTAAQQAAAGVKARFAQTTSLVATVTAFIGGAYASATQAVTTTQERGTSSTTSSQNALETAKLSLSKVSAPPKSYDIAAAYAGLLSAQAALDGSTLRAPTDGTVISVSAQVGETASGTVVVVDTAALRLRGNVGESEVARLSVGQRATVRVDAVGRAMNGSIATIDAGATQTGVPLYAVEVAIDEIAPGLRSGMSGSARVVVDARENVLTVPSAAVHTQGTRTFVQLMKDGRPVDREIKVGVADGMRVEILNGLVEGDVVVLPRDRSK